MLRDDSVSAPYLKISTKEVINIRRELEAFAVRNGIENGRCLAHRRVHQVRESYRWAYEFTIDDPKIWTKP